MSAPFAAETEAPWKAGLRGARANLVPGIALQVFALALVLAYYWHAPTRDAFTKLTEFRASTGLLYGIVATAVFGGLLPALYLKLIPSTRSRYTTAQSLALVVFWAYKGFEVDLWYRILAATVGEGTDAGSVLLKMFLDQFVYCPIWAVPSLWFYFAWMERGFQLAPVLADIRRPRWYLRSVLPLLISNLGVWVPAVCIIYSLPTALQLPLFNLVLCFYTLLVAHLSRRAPAPAVVAE